jgi:acyl carrier protein
MTELDRVRKVVAEVLRVPLEALSPSSRLSDLATLDSLSLVEIASALDDEFGIRVPSDDLSTAVTITDLERIVLACRVP